MSPRGRPKNPTPSVRIVLSGWLHPHEDADILAWWQDTPKGQRMNALKTALRSGGLALSSPAPHEEDRSRQAAEDLLSVWDL